MSDAMLEEFMERYGQERFLADSEGKEGRRVPDNPSATDPEYLQTTTTAALPERTR